MSREQVWEAEGDEDREGFADRCELAVGSRGKKGVTRLTDSRFGGAFERYAFQ